jgi:hypothetical protein
LPRLTSNLDSPDLSLPEARITGVSHHCPARRTFDKDFSLTSMPALWRVNLLSFSLLCC